MPYLMGGYPDLAGSLRVGEAFADAGADLVELGVPFSDPLAEALSSRRRASRRSREARPSSSVLERSPRRSRSGCRWC